VSLYAKLRGYKVAANDNAFRAATVGRALIENSHVPLTYDDLVMLSMPVEKLGYAEIHLAPDVFAIEHARYMDTVLANARKLEGAKRWLALLLVVKYALRTRPMGNFGGVTVMRQVAAGDWGSVNPSYVRDLNTRGISRHPIRPAEILRKQINFGVFSNGQENKFSRRDVFDFLANLEGDILYLDPPYFSTLSYERALKPLDELLNGGPVEVRRNPFSTERPQKILPQLFEAADHIPTWVLSYGNQRIELDGLIKLVRKFRPSVEGKAIRYVHCTGLAGEESRRRNRELLVVGRK
jgi:hypothetical protein